MIEFLFIYSVFSYLFIAGVLAKMSGDLGPKHIPGSIVMFIISPFVLPFLIGYGFVTIVDK